MLMWPTVKMSLTPLMPLRPLLPKPITADHPDRPSTSGAFRISLIKADALFVPARLPVFPPPKRAEKKRPSVMFL
ncbi:hypothetical protein EYF80_050360 [Liparis tanakae]|uniref:Uncharacterized protein n=1 Tax=Liparis tanakae TaxID=230148 RepID=A0A4Z2FFD1_9TELE|nr:hypothetical protein EYF80_050360 [Liparis tanakae]